MDKEPRQRLQRLVVVVPAEAEAEAEVVAAVAVAGLPLAEVSLELVELERPH